MSKTHKDNLIEIKHKLYDELEKITTNLTLDQLQTEEMREILDELIDISHNGFIKDIIRRIMRRI